MFYHPNDNKATIIAKYFCFFVVFLSIIGIVGMIFVNNVKMPQKEMVLKIDINNKVNICLPEEKEEKSEDSFLNF